MTDTVFQLQQQQQWNRAHVSHVWSQNGHNHRSITTNENILFEINKSQLFYDVHAEQIRG